MKSAFGLNIPQTLEEACYPQRIALLVYDMQALPPPQRPLSDER
jgi:hypothetical protein